MCIKIIDRPRSVSILEHGFEPFINLFQSRAGTLRGDRPGEMLFFLQFERLLEFLLVFS